VSKERYARTKFEIVGRAKNLQGRFARVTQHETHIVPQAISEDRIRQVALGVIHVANCVALRNGAVAQPSKLREDEPHPVGLLVSRRQFFDDLAAHRILGLYEANKISIGHSDAKASFAPAGQDRAILARKAPKELAKILRFIGECNGVGKGEVQRWTRADPIISPIDKTTLPSPRQAFTSRSSAKSFAPRRRMITRHGNLGCRRASGSCFAT
jgi:hypothetical protein